ncbi:ELMO domain-containing protein 2 [Trichonephila clavipes]|uniref:ELMO domain-containing protein 2 n=1 Tax=Trichonephila clavipes TaxID=2585209 RepID=A0A8X6S5V0_TRICX|nr:ELMO domain-containing protein 2 [Trichonephila clavipes]
MKSCHAQHEEADTKIVYHTCFINYPAEIVIRSIDTDIAAIMLGNMHHLKNDLVVWMLTETDGEGDIDDNQATDRSSNDEDENINDNDLWALLNPDKPLQSRISKQWTEIGFQGDDPKTDFRGMGILGLENLLYFATEHCEAARHVLLHSNHPNYGYSFAIVGINLTSMAYDMLKNQSLQVHFYNSIKGKPSIDHFHFVYCYLFYEFDKFWLSEKPRDIMEFSRIRAKFQTKILKQLENPKTQLKLSFLIKTL